MARTLTDNTGFDNFNGRLYTGRNTQAIPGVVLMTDTRLDAPLHSAQNLPPGSAVVIRGKSAASRREMFAALLAPARERKLRLLATLPLDPRMRRTAHGVHLNEAWIRRHPHRRCLFAPKTHIVTASAHSRAAVIRAIRFGADAVFVSPLHASASHPGKGGLGFWRFYALFADLVDTGKRRRREKRTRTAKIVALGGVTIKDAGRLRTKGVWAIAGIDLFRPHR